MTLYEVVLQRFDGDEEVAKRYLRSQVKHYRGLAKHYPNLIQLAEGYERAARSSGGVSAVRDAPRRKSRPKRVRDSA